VNLQNWILLIGIVLIILWGLAAVTEQPKSGVRRVDQLEGIHLGYVFAIADWACIVYFLDWRRGLADLGLPEAGSWVLAPIGLILVIGSSIAAWNTGYGEDPYRIGLRRTEDQSRWRWVGLPLFYLTALAGYIVVVALQRN
jgi:hypothetical protein